MKLWDMRRPTSVGSFSTLPDDVMTMAVHPTADLLAWYGPRTGWCHALHGYRWIADFSEDGDSRIP